MKTCFKCGAEITAEFISRRDECPRCCTDLHVCCNCEFYEKGRANDCREPQAEPVTEKDRSNYCDFFRFRKPGGEHKSGRAEADKLWKELFKK